MIIRHEIKLAVVGVSLLLAGACLIARSHGPMRDARIAGAAVRILDPTRSPQIGAAVVFHGLSANRILMQEAGQWLAAQGFRVYLVDAPGHGRTPGTFSHTETLDSSLRVLSELLQSGHIDPQTTILVGHSMGGETAIRLADYFPSAATVALSPAPMVLPRRMPMNLLVIEAQLDLPPIKEITDKLIRAANGTRASPEDFQQRRAVEKVEVPWASHGSIMLDPRALRMMAGWARKAIGLAGPPDEPRGAPLTGELVGIAGLVLLFPLTAALVVTACRNNRLPSDDRPPPPPVQLLLFWCVASLLGVAAVSFWDPQRVFPFYTGGYLACFLLFTGVVLALLLKQHIPNVFHNGYRPALAAVALGVIMIFLFGGWLNWQLTEVWMNGTRWLYVVPLVLVNLPYTLAEEVALGPPTASRRLWRFGIFLLLRLIIWLVLLAGIIVLLSGQVLMALLAPYFLVISLGQRLGADSLRRRTGSPAAAAIFSAILAAWFIAAVFPLA
jgi:pimeloyl-ACP methyl ester carboxylesterase